jgi:hypothetical protein
MGKRLIITEDERHEILNLHKSHIFEAPSDAVLGNQGTPVVGATPAGPTIANTMSQPQAGGTVAKDMTSKVFALQNSLNAKFKSGLKSDGKWGPKTATAVLNALKGSANQKPNAVTTTPSQQPATQQPTTQPATQQPSQTTNTTVKNPGLANPYTNTKNPLNQLR